MDENSQSKSVSDAIFGGATPVDTASKDHEIEQRLEKENSHKYYKRQTPDSNSSNLKIITWNIDGLHEENSQSKSVSDAIFGGATPVDTASKDHEIEQRLEKENSHKYYKRQTPDSNSSNLKFITWNIDGLHEENYGARTTAVCCKIIEENADIVFLQEVTQDCSIYMLGNMFNYHCLFGNSEEYYVAILLKKSTVEFVDFKIIDFPDSTQLRHALKVNVKFKNMSLCLINSHLESLKPRSDERKKQLNIIFEEMIAEPENKTVIFGGDLNLRDYELTEIGGVPEGIEDMWIVNRRKKDCEFTWDLSINDNLKMPAKPKLRFDRVYVRNSSPPMLKSVHFDLIGRERLSSFGCFPSDHFGILCHFRILQLHKRLSVSEN